MAIRASSKKNCSDCENYKRKLKENDHTVSARDVLIEMLQTELKKKESLYRNAIDEHEKLRFVHCSVVQDYTNLKEIHKKLTEENKKLCEENRNLLAKIRETENVPKSSNGLNDQTCEPFDKKSITNIKNVADGISNIQNIMLSQNNSLRSMLVQLLDELKKSKMEHSPERNNQIVENKDNSNETNESLKKQIEDLNSFVVKLQKENKKIKENLYEKQVSLKNCLTLLENHNSDIDNLSKHVEGLCNQRDKFSQQVTALENELVSKENEISKLKSETVQTSILEESKLNNDVCCLKAQIETYLSEYKKLKDEIETTVKDKIELEKKVNEYQAQSEQLQAELQEKLKEFRDNTEDMQLIIDQLKNDLEAARIEQDSRGKYQAQCEQLQAELQEKLKEFGDNKKDMQLIIDQLKNDLEAARVEQDSRGIQCSVNRPALCNTSIQETPIMKNRIVQSLEDCLSVCYKNTQVDDLEIIDNCKKSFEKEMIEVEVHKQELQTLNNEFLQYRCVMDYRIQSLEKDNNELKENISIMASDHERNLKEVDEEYHKCKHELATKVKVLEEDNSILKNSLESANCLKSELDKVKNDNRIYLFQCKIDELELENTGLRDTLSNMTNENGDIKKLEENYCIYKHAFETKIKQLEEENKHVRDTLHIVTSEDKKSIEDDFITIKTILENKIRSLEQENNYLKENVKDYEAKLAKNEAEKKELADNVSKEIAQNQTIINKLIDKQSIHQQIPNSDSDLIGIIENFDWKTIIQLKIKQLIDNKFNLEQNLATVSTENLSYFNTIEELSKSMNTQIHGNTKFRVLTCSLDQVDQANQTEEIKDMENENSELKEELNELQRKVLALEMELENANLELTEYEEENRSYSQRLQTLMNEMTCLQETKLLAEADINDYNLRIIHLQEEFAVLSRERDLTIAELNNKITELESKVINFDCNVSKLKESKEENEQLQNKLDDTQTMLNNVRNELESLHSENTKFKSLEILVQEKDEQLKEYCNKLNVVQEQLEDNKSKYQEFENKIQELESKKEILESKIADNEKLIEETTKETDRLKKLISDLEEERSYIKNNNLEKTEENNSELSEQLRSLQEQLKKKKIIIKSLEECIDKSNIVLQHSEKEIKGKQQENEIFKNKMKGENSFLKQKSEKLYEENQILKEQLNKTTNEETLKLKIEYNKLLKESQAKDKNLKNLKQQLMLLLAAQSNNKPATAQKSVSFAADTKLFDPRTKRSRQGSSKSNDSNSNTPKNKKDVEKKSTPFSRQGRSANQIASNSTRSIHCPTATAGLKSQSLPNTLRKGALPKNNPKNMSVYLTLSNPYPPEKDGTGTEKRRSGSGDEKTVSRDYGAVPKNRPNKDKVNKEPEKLPASHNIRTVNTGCDPINIMPMEFTSAPLNKSNTTTRLRETSFKSIGSGPRPDEKIRYSTTNHQKKNKSIDPSIRQFNTINTYPKKSKLVGSIKPSEFFDDEEIMEPGKLRTSTAQTMPIEFDEAPFVPIKSKNRISSGTTPKTTSEYKHDETSDQRKNVGSKRRYRPDDRAYRISARPVTIQQDSDEKRKSRLCFHPRIIITDADDDRTSTSNATRMSPDETVDQRKSSRSRPVMLRNYNNVDDDTIDYKRITPTSTFYPDDEELFVEMTIDEEERTDQRRCGLSFKPTDKRTSDQRKSTLSSRPRRMTRDAADGRTSTSKATNMSPEFNFRGTADQRKTSRSRLVTFYPDDEDLSLEMSIDKEECRDQRDNIKPIDKSGTYSRNFRLAGSTTIVDTPLDRKSRMSISTGTDPIKPLRLCRDITALPETEQKEQMLWPLKINVPMKKSFTDSTENTKQKSVQINKTSCNCLSVIMKQYQTQDGRVQNSYAENVTQDVIYDAVEVDQDCAHSNVNHTGCSFSFGSSYWAQAELDTDYSDESNPEDTNIRFATKYNNCQRDDKSCDVGDCDEEENCSSDVSC